MDVSGKIALDVGASTGGFSQILIENKAKKVFAIDVGSGQLHPSIEEMPEVINIEKTHVRELTDKIITEQCQVLVIDVSFISLEKIFPFVHSLIESGSDAMVLVKPQFEVGKDNVGKRHREKEPLVWRSH